MSSAFFNQNTKLSSSDLTKIKGFRNKFYFDVDESTKKTINTFSSKKYVKPINNFTDYNFIKNQLEINYCISNNVVCKKNIINTGGEIYIGNYISDLSLVNNSCTFSNNKLFINYSISGSIIDYNFKTLCSTDCSGQNIDRFK